MASAPGTGAQGVLVLDEAQDGQVASDLLQGLLRDARLGSRPGDLRVVVVTDPTLEPSSKTSGQPSYCVPRDWQLSRSRVWTPLLLTQ